MSTAGRREPLSRQRALDAAVALADEAGVENVSMRRLASRLGVTPMALYKHVADKEDLLDGMVDTLIAAYDPPAASGTDWRGAVRTRILSARQVLARHRWARSVIETRTRRTPAVLGYQDALAGTFMAGGFSADLTHHVMHVLGHRIWGFSPEAFDGGASPSAPEETDIGAGTAAPENSPDEPEPEELAELEAGFGEFSAAYPHITAIALAATGGDLSAAGTGCDEDFEFTFALDLLLDAFDRLRAEGWTSPARH